MIKLIKNILIRKTQTNILKDPNIPKDWLMPRVTLHLQIYQVELLLLTLKTFQPQNKKQKDDITVLQTVLTNNLKSK